MKNILIKRILKESMFPFIFRNTFLFYWEWKNFVALNFPNILYLI